MVSSSFFPAQNSGNSFFAGFSRAITTAVVAAFFLVLAQIFLTLPLINQAEMYELGLAEPQTIWQGNRLLLTIIAATATSFAFVFLLWALEILLLIKIHRQNFLLWTFGFWLAIFFLPALQLPPALPGTHGDTYGFDELTYLYIRQSAWFVIVIPSVLAFLIFAEPLASYFNRSQILKSGLKLPAAMPLQLPIAILLIVTAQILSAWLLQAGGMLKPAQDSAPASVRADTSSQVAHHSAYHLSAPGLSAYGLANDLLAYAAVLELSSDELQVGWQSTAQLRLAHSTTDHDEINAPTGLHAESGHKDMARQALAVSYYGRSLATSLVFSFVLMLGFGYYRR